MVGAVHRLDLLLDLLVLETRGTGSMRHWIAVEEHDNHQPVVMGSVWVESDIPQIVDAYEREGRNVHILEVEFTWNDDDVMKFSAGWY